jgi:hypothetical protein
MSEYDHRQYKLMLENAKVPISTINALKKTIDNLESLIYALEEKDHVWNKQFMSQWWILEDVYAEICYTDQNYLSDSTLERVNQTRSIIIELVNQKIRRDSSG